MSKATKLYVCKLQNKCTYHKKVFYVPKLSSIFIWANFISWAKPMHVSFEIFSVFQFDSNGKNNEV